MFVINLLFFSVLSDSPLLRTVHLLICCGGAVLAVRGAWECAGGRLELRWCVGAVRWCSASLLHWRQSNAMVRAFNVAAMR